MLSVTPCARTSLVHCGAITQANATTISRVNRRDAIAAFIRWCLPLALNRLKESVNAPLDVVADGVFPDGHAFIHASTVHGSPECFDRVVAIADLQTAQISGTFALYRVGAVAVGAVLIEQACAFRHHVFPSLIRVFQYFGVFLRRNSDGRTKEKRSSANDMVFHG